MTWLVPAGVGRRKARLEKIKSGREKKKKNNTSISYIRPRHCHHPPDTEGSEINVAAAPKIERWPPSEQDAGRQCGNKHRSPRSGRVISVAPLDLQEWTPIHCCCWLPAGRGTHTHTERKTKVWTHLRTLPMGGRQEWDGVHLLEVDMTESQLPHGVRRNFSFIYLFLFFWKVLLVFLKVLFPPVANTLKLKLVVCVCECECVFTRA